MATQAYNEALQLCSYIQTQGVAQALPQICGPSPLNATQLSERVRSAYLTCMTEVNLLATNPCWWGTLQHYAGQAYNSHVGNLVVAASFWEGMNLVHLSLTSDIHNPSFWARVRNAGTFCAGAGIMLGIYAVGGTSFLPTVVLISAIWGVTHSFAKKAEKKEEKDHASGASAEGDPVESDSGQASEETSAAQANPAEEKRQAMLRLLAQREGHS